jgi:hypothetical protein
MVLPDIDKFRFKLRLGLFSAKKENWLIIGSTRATGGSDITGGISCSDEPDPPQASKNELKKATNSGWTNL